MTRAERVLEGEVLAPESDEQRAVRERLAFLAWLLDAWAERPHATRRASRLFLALLTLALVAAAALSGALLYLLIAALFG